MRDAVDRDETLVLGDNVSNDTKAEAGPVGFGGEKWVEDMGEMFFGNPPARIYDGHGEVGMGWLNSHRKRTAADRKSVV